jgi:arylsulfatase A-like enzyme
MGKIQFKKLGVAVSIAALAGTALLGGCKMEKKKAEKKPNFLILMSDNHSWNHLGCYGDPVVKTPNIDKIAEDGVRFTNAFCSAPSCTPARASMLTGQDIWRLEEGANLWGTLPAKFEVYPDVLENAGYLVGYEGKGWGPGDTEASERDRNPGGDQYDSFEEFYNEREKGQPFMYWFSSRDPHRPFKRNGGKKAKIDLDKIVVPSYLPDCKEVREDIADYYAEIQHFDKEVGGYISLLKEMGQLDNTIVIVCSDNGWQMPRGLANLYDMGTKIPMIVSMPERFKGSRVVEDFIYLTDLAPTFLELAGLSIPEYMTAKSLVNILESDKSGVIEPERDFVVTARERHAYVRKNGAGYGGRAIQTKDYLYIRNYEENNWPAGDPPLYGDVDAHMLQYPCPAKMYLLENKDKEGVSQLFDLAFAKRPAEELYDLKKDPDQMVNVAADANYLEIKKQMQDKMNKYLTETKDPRVVGGEMKWMNAEYFAEMDKTPRPSQRSIDALGLEEEYDYDQE